MQTHLKQRTGTRVLVVAAIAMLALSASACGGSKKSASSTTDASANVAWAGSVCDAFTTWKTSLQDIKSSLTTGGVPKSSDLRQAGRHFEDATKSLKKQLKDLGTPPTAGDSVKSTVQTLEDSLSASTSTIEDTLNSGSGTLSSTLAMIPTLTGELGKMKTALTTAADNLKQADPGGKLEQAFKQAPSCSPYVSS